MAQPSVLLLELDPDRRKTLSFGLTAEGYEVVPVVDVEEGLRFAAGLGPAVIVAPVSLALDEEGGIPTSFAIHGEARTLLLLGDDPAEGEGLRDQALVLPTAGLEDVDVVRRIRLALVGREIGVDPDYRLEALVGDFSLVSPLDLVRRLHRLGATARVEARGGSIFLRGGDLIASQCGPVHGVKAFGRLARRTDGPFRIQFGAEGMPPRDVLDDADDVLRSAAADVLVEVPDLQSRFKVHFGPQLFSQPLTSLQQEVLSVLHEGGSLGRVLDASHQPDGVVLREVEALERRGVVERLEPHPDVAVITDSTCDLPSELVRSHRIVVVPLTIHFGDEVYVDREQLEPAAFYRMLTERAEHPYTNPPSPEKFALEYHRRLPRQGLISIHLSAKLSQTFAHARQAALDPQLSELAREAGKQASDLMVLDSGQVSLPLGLLAVFAARMAERGLAVATIAQRIEAIAARMQTLFLVDTLDYLARGGRIGKARALLGKIAGIKPILGVRSGEVVAIERVRGRRSAQIRLVDLAVASLTAGRPAVVGIAHAKAPARADRLRELIEQKISVAELHIAEMGPVLGVHAGPGCVGAAFFEPQDDEAALIAPLERELGPGAGA